jgi:hypothetical protein
MRPIPTIASCWKKRCERQRTLNGQSVVAQHAEVIEVNMNEMLAAGTFTHCPDIEKEGQLLFCPSFAFFPRNPLFAWVMCVKCGPQPSGR